MKSLIVLLIAVSAASAHNFCTPGSFYKDDCNYCLCSYDGKAAACTDMMCPGIQRFDNFCEPGQTFKFDDFSSCTCSHDGSTAACTLGVLERKNDNFCKPGTTFSPDDCNTCMCSQDGSSAACTLKLCPTIDNLKDNTPKQVCKPFSTFKDYCNTCFCADDGLTFECTYMWCDKDLWNKDGSLKTNEKSQRVSRSVKQVCAPNTQFKEQCNSCICSKDGLSKSCTMMKCDDENKDEIRIENLINKVCKPGKVFSPDGCNTCVCDKDGVQAACTRRLCVPSFVKAFKADENQKWGPKYNEGETCTPGKLFYSECNRCVCTKTGISAFCTLMDCGTIH